MISSITAIYSARHSPRNHWKKAMRLAAATFPLGLGDFPGRFVFQHRAIFLGKPLQKLENLRLFQSSDFSG